MSGSDAHSAGVWSGVAEAYDVSFAHLCAELTGPLLDAVGPPRGRLVDVGAGTGRLAAAALDRGWSVTALEPDAEMRAVAAERLPDVQVLDAALPSVATDPAEAVVAAFVLNHVGQPRRCARALADLALPGGRVAASIWTSDPADSARLFGRLCELAGAVTTPGHRLPADEDFERSADGLATLLDGAGLSDVAAETIPVTWRVDVEDWWRGVSSGVGGAGQAYLAQTPAVQRRMRAALDEVTDYRDGDALVLTATAALAVGVRPD